MLRARSAIGIVGVVLALFALALVYRAHSSRRAISADEVPGGSGIRSGADGTGAAPVRRAPLVDMKHRGRPLLPAPSFLPAKPQAQVTEVALTAPSWRPGAPLILPKERLTAYLSGKNRSAMSLLAAASLSRDPSLRQEARRSYPEDPRVLLDSLLRNELPPGERMKALEAIRKAEPDNSLGDYLLAKECLDRGDSDGAISALLSGCAKPFIDGHGQELILEREAAYREAGIREDEAVAAAHWDLELAHVKPLQELAGMILALQRAYVERNDAESGRLVALMGTRLGEQMQLQVGAKFLVDQVAAIGVESRFLQVMNPAEELVAGGITVGDRLAELQNSTRRIKELIHGVAAEALPPPVMIEFLRRVDRDGEIEAFQWLRTTGY